MIVGSTVTILATTGDDEDVEEGDGDVPGIGTLTRAPLGERFCCCCCIASVSNSAAASIVGN